MRYVLEMNTQPHPKDLQQRIGDEYTVHHHWNAERSATTYYAIECEQEYAHMRMQLRSTLSHEFHELWVTSKKGKCFTPTLR